MTALPVPEMAEVPSWVTTHLGALVGDEPQPRLPIGETGPLCGGQVAADRALAGLDLGGYASRRNEVWPPRRRGASMLSPYIRHGLLSLPRVWDDAAVQGAPARDRDKFRDELLWQEYSRHLYARVGRATAEPFRYTPAVRPGATDPWAGDLACVRLAVDELEAQGWLVNQTRMWLASHWSVRHGADWRAGEDRFFTHLLDGSRAANRVGWQWTVGAATGKPYGFSRWQVQKRAPGLCGQCPRRHDCPIDSWPADPALEPVAAPSGMHDIGDVEEVAGPAGPASPVGRADAVWLTAESLGDDDPALAAHPELPAVFVFDEPLLAHLRLSAKRLVFLAECLADLGSRREVSVFVGDPVAVLAGRSLATTFAPVPGNHRLRAMLDIAELHPWPWLRRPSPGPVTSFSAWRGRSARPRTRSRRGDG
ncbi:MAG: hypothetical protein NVS3B21_16830 [Acidimicrobiales bacterium]